MKCYIIIVEEDRDCYTCEKVFTDLDKAKNYALSLQFNSVSPSIWEEMTDFVKKYRKNALFGISIDNPDIMVIIYERELI